MSDTSKNATITSNILTNGVGKITGAILATVLVAITAWVSLSFLPIANQNCNNALQQGFDPAGVNDNEPVFAAWATANPTGGCLAFPSGKYKSLSQWNYSFTSGVLTLAGAGADNTVLYWPTGNGINITLPTTAKQSVHVKDMSLTTGAAAAGIALGITGTATVVTTQSDVINTVFRGDAGQSDYWTAGVNISTVSDINFINDLFIGGSANTGVGIEIAGSSPTEYAFNYGVTNNSFESLLYGIIAFSYVQGIYVSSSQFSGVQGIAIFGNAGIQCCVQVVNGQFNTIGAGILTNNLPLYQLLVSTSVFYMQAGAFGIDLNGIAGGSIVGNFFQTGTSAGPASITGIAVASSETNFSLSIADNNFYDIAVGINLLSTAANVMVQGNAFNLVTTPIGNNSASTTIIEQNNLGYNPVGVTGPTNVPTSPATICAGPAPETHYYLQSATNTATVKLTNTSGPLIGTMSNATIPVVTNLGPNECEFVTWATTDPTYTKSVH